MLNAKKKKPRQRNRARNKSNRQQKDAQDVHSECSDNEETQENEANDKLKQQLAETQVKANSAERGGENESKNSALPTANNQLAIQPLFENNETIKMIQQMMRAKLLKPNAENKLDTKPIVNKNGKECGDNKSNQPAKQAHATKNATLPAKGKKSVGEVAEGVKKSKSKEQIGENLTEQSAFIANLQKKMENAIANGGADLPNALLDNLQKLFNQDPISDVESTDDEDEYIEYIYKPRQYFLVSLCNHCKSELVPSTAIACTRCHMTYYCQTEHMKCDTAHRQLCYALQQVADSCGGNIFHKCADFTPEQFRSYRIVTIRNVEHIINRPLTATEQEVILFPRICNDINCRECRFEKLEDCKKCGQVAYCKDKPAHFPKTHQQWCKAYQLFKNLVSFQAKFGRLEPSLPTKILKDLPGACSNTKQILNKLAFDMQDPCEYAALSQISTCPLTAWYALKLCGALKKSETMVIHLIGAEIEFEVDLLHKWELFFLHITPTLKELNVVFVGPELNPGKISFEQLKKTKCCRACRKNERTVKYHFQSQLYHDYCGLKTFLKPDLICFFNAGLYRYNGFQMEDTWPDTILAAANLKCPVVVTSYTEYETPMDMARFVQEANRSLNVILPPTVNPFASEKPERNFISDDVVPLMFKNYYCFVVE